MRKAIKLLCCLLTFFLVTQVQAQQKDITGTVVDAKGNPLSGVSVKLKGTKTIITTGADGKFSLKAGSKDVLQLSFVGFTDQEVNVSGQASFSITLEEASQKLDDVVVVGYGTQKKKDLTGSISSISSDHLNLGGTTANLAQAIQGRAAGVQVQQSDFSPGGAMSITIRGGNSINTTNAPLYVVDGFISDNGNQVNPNDIEDIQILKDASAAAIYGARGGNGVVLITTKKGKAGKAIIEGDVSRGRQFLKYKPALLTGQQYTDIQNAIAAEDGNPPPFPSSFPVSNTDWWKIANQNADVDNASVSVSSGDKNSKLYIAVNYINQKGVLQHTGMQRYSARIGAEKSLNDRIKIGANFYGASKKTDLQSYTGDITAPLFGLLTAPPNIPVYNADGSYYRYLGKNNAYAVLIEPTNDSYNKLFNGNMFLDYQLIKDLTYHISVGGEYSQTTNGQYTPTTLVAGQAANGIASEQIYTSFRWLAEQYLTYKFKTGVHSFTALVGTSSQRDNFEALGAGSRGFPTDLFLYYNLNAGSIPTIAGAATPMSSKIESKLSSYFGRLNYSYKEELLATFTLRRDGSSKFGSSNRWGTFPSGAIAWRLSDKDFVKNSKVVSSLKVRLGYGLTGNDRIADYASLSRFTNYSTVLRPDGSLQVGIEPATLANNDLKWESTSQFDLGVDVGFANGRVNATVDIYRKKTSDLLINIPIGQWWGFTSQLGNAGAIENKGIELGITTENFKGKDFGWSTTFNIAYNKQKCLSLANSIKIISTNTANPSGVVSAREFTRLEPGKELGTIYGFKYAGVIKTGEKYDAQPNSKAGDPKYEDLDGDGVITPSDRTYLGNTSPRYITGLSNDFHYKGFNLNIFFQGAFGYSLYNMNRLVLESTTGADALNRFVAGKNENTSIPREGYFLSTYGSYVNSRFVENASYVRLKSVSLSYSVPASVFKAVKFIEGLQVYASAQNLLTFTGYTGTDPEVNVHAGSAISSTNTGGNITGSGANVGGGLDFGVFPSFRTFLVGAKLAIH